MATRRGGAPPIQSPGHQASGHAPLPLPAPAAPGPGPLALRLAETQWMRFFTHRRKLAFWSGLHKLIRAGVGFADALRTLGGHYPGAYGRAIEQAAQALERGQTLGQALAPHGHHLERSYVALCAFAERTGTLEPVLAGIVEDLETQQAIRWQALLPSIYLGYLLAAVVLVGPLASIGPALYARGDAPGPAPSPLGLYAGGLLMNLLLLALVVAAWILLPLALCALGLEERVDRLRLANPLTGPLYRNLYGSRFFLGLGLALKTGMGMQQSLGLACQASSSPYLRAREPALVRDIDRGQRLTDALATLSVLPGSLLSLLAASERAGDLDRGLAEIAADARQAAVGAMKVLMVLAIAVMGGLLLLRIVLLILANVFGPILGYFEALGSA